MSTVRMTIFGYIVQGDHDIMAAMRRRDDDSLKLAFDTARDGGVATYELRGQHYEIRRNADYTFVILLQTEGRELL